MIKFYITLCAAVIVTAAANAQTQKQQVPLAKVETKKEEPLKQPAGAKFVMFNEMVPVVGPKGDTTSFTSTWKCGYLLQNKVFYRNQSEVKNIITAVYPLTK